MVLTFYDLASWMLGVVVLYAAASRGLFRATNGLRLSLIDLAAELNKSPDFPKEEKEHISRALDDAHSARAAWRLTMCLLLVAMMFPFLSVPRDSIPNKHRMTHDIFWNRFTIATVTNSVLASVIFVLVAITLSVFISSLNPIIRLVTGKRYGADDQAIRV